MKTCKTCGVEKLSTEYYKIPSGSRNECKVCCREKQRAYNAENTEKIKSHNKKYREKNKAALNARNRQYYKDNKEKLNAYNKKYREENKEYIDAHIKKYREDNKDMLAAKRNTPEAKAKKAAYKKEYDSKQENKDKRNAKRRERMKNDPEYKLKNVLRARLSNVLKSQNAKKVSKTTELLGCTIQEFKVYIESLWEPWMNWDNHGYDYENCWHIDHITPCASFDLTDPKQQLKCFHYSNLQPLRGIDNISKSDSV